MSFSVKYACERWGGLINWLFKPDQRDTQKPTTTKTPHHMLLVLYREFFLLSYSSLPFYLTLSSSSSSSSSSWHVLYRWQSRSCRVCLYLTRLQSHRSLLCLCVSLAVECLPVTPDNSVLDITRRTRRSAHITQTRESGDVTARNGIRTRNILIPDRNSYPPYHAPSALSFLPVCTDRPPFFSQSSLEPSK